MSKKEKPKRGLVAVTDNELKRKYPGSGLASDISVIPEDALWLPSRSIYLNYTMGGGIQYGRICEIFGGESSGKSLVAMDFGYSAQFLGGVLLWNDAEQSFDPQWAQTNGLDLTRTYVYNETSIERISDWAADMAITMRSKLVNNEPIVIVTDSIAALDCEDNINSTQTNGKAEMGNRAKAIYRFLRTRNQLFSELGIVYIFINQLRKKVGATMFEDPDCFNYNTIIPLVDGRCLPIGKIVKEKIKCDVWSYNEELDLFEAKPITNWVIKPQLEPGEKWLSIVTNGPGSKGGKFGIICTEKHGILTNMGWVNAKYLTPSYKVLTKYESIINNSLEKFLLGSFVGDSTVRLRNNNTADYQLCNNGNKEYLNWKVEKLSGFFKFKKVPTIKGFKFTTQFSVELGLEAKENNRRNPLRLFHNQLKQPDILSLAIWYMDDGHLSKEKFQGGISISHKRTNILKLCSELKRIGYDCYPYKKGLKFKVDGFRKLSFNIREYVPECMQYKLLPEDRGFYNDFTLYSEKKIKSLWVDVISVKEAGSRNYRKLHKFDITVADNHNFLAGGKQNGFIAHNTTPGGDAMKFFASQRLAFFRKKGIYDEVNGHKVWIGNEASIRMKKNKLAPPRPSFTTNIYFNAEYGKTGFGRYDNMVELMERTGVVTRSKGSSNFMLEGESIAKGAENFQGKLENDKELRTKLLRKANINTISRLQLKLDRLRAKGINRYPVKAKKSSRSSDTDE